MHFYGSWPKESVNHFFDCFRTKGLARENIDISISIQIDKMCSDITRFDQLNKRIPPLGGIVRGKVLENGLAIGFHVNISNECFNKTFYIFSIGNLLNFAALAIQDKMISPIPLLLS